MHPFSSFFISIFTGTPPLPGGEHVVPYECVTSERVWASLKMFVCVVRFRGNGRLCDEIIHFYQWRRRTESTDSYILVSYTVVEWRNCVFRATRVGSLLDRFPGVMSNPGTRRNGSSIKIRLTGKTELEAIMVTSCRGNQMFYLHTNSLSGWQSVNNASHSACLWIFLVLA